MARVSDIRVPDLGDFRDVEVIEVLVAPGDRIEQEQALITLETEKASMEVPSPAAGRILEVRVRVGSRVSAGDVIAQLEEDSPDKPAGSAQKTADSAAQHEKSGNSPKTAEKPQAISAKNTDSPENTPASAAKFAGPVDIQAEVLVLGAGPGGYSAAFRAADLGKTVVLVERDAELGGVCLNVGCIPSKALLHTAHVIEQAAALAAHGVEFGPPNIRLEALRRFKDGVVTRLTGGLKALAKKRKVTVLRGRGQFSSAHTLSVAMADGGTRSVGFDAAIIAAGSEPVMLPGLPQDPRVMDSTGALALADIPARLLVIGGGIIGLEMANVYAALGSRVEVVEMTAGLLPGADPDLVKPLARRMRERLAAIYLSTRVAEAGASAQGIQVRFEGKDAPAPQIYDRVLVAVGRRPNGNSINAEAAGVAVDARGYIPTDAQLRSNVPHIFAIGDITRPPMLAHKAVHEGKTAAEVIAGHKAAFDARCIPSVVYTEPEVAWTGLTEQEAKEKGIEVQVGRFPWAANGRSLGMGYNDGLTKILFDRQTGRALGGAAVGPGAGELMAEIGLAIEMGADAQDIGLTIHAHPTLSETVAMSAEQIAGTLTDL